jgi:hypothetical protein
MLLSPRLILENGVKGYEAQLHWAAAALKAYKMKARGNKS